MINYKIWPCFWCDGKTKLEDSLEGSFVVCTSDNCGAVGPFCEEAEEAVSKWNNVYKVMQNEKYI